MCVRACVRVCVRVSVCDVVTHDRLVHPSIDARLLDTHIILRVLTWGTWRGAEECPEEFLRSIRASYFLKWRPLVDGYCISVAHIWTLHELILCYYGGAIDHALVAPSYGQFTN